MSDEIDMTAKDAKGNTVLDVVWVTHWDVEGFQYLDSVSKEDWEETYKAPITEYASNTPYVPKAQLDSALAEVSRLTAERDAAMAWAVKVKPLVWETDGSDALAADVYRIGINYGLTSHQFWLLYRDYAIATANDHDALKAAAQADYAARILAALIPAPDTLRQVREAIEALSAMPEGYCFCSKDRIGDDSKIHEPECRDLRAALAMIPEDE